MRDLFINALELLCKIGVWLVVGGATGIAWYDTGNPWVTMAVLLLAFIAAVIIFGLVFLLIDMNDSMRKLLERVESNSPPPPAPTVPARVTDPHPST